MNPTPTPDSPSPTDIARLRELLACSKRSGIATFELRNAAPALLDELDLHRKKQDEIIALCESEGVHHPAVAINRLKAERDKLREEVDRLKGDNKKLCVHVEDARNLLGISGRKIATQALEINSLKNQQIPELYASEWVDPMDVISERDSLRRENAELKAKLK